jgi:hypothetical protein
MTARLDEPRTGLSTRKQRGNRKSVTSKSTLPVQRLGTTGMRITRVGFGSSAVDGDWGLIRRTSTRTFARVAPTPGAGERMEHLPFPATDPVYGDGGSFAKIWRRPDAFTLHRLVHRHESGLTRRQPHGPPCDRSTRPSPANSWGWFRPERSAPWFFSGRL